MWKVERDDECVDDVAALHLDSSTATGEGGGVGGAAAASNRRVTTIVTGVRQFWV